MSAAIKIRGVTKTFGEKIAVDRLDLEVPQGSVCAFLGPNGAGKTTTIRMIMSIIFPDRGEISVLGKASALESKDRIGYLPEERGVYRKMKVGDFLAYMARLKGVDGAGLPQKVKAWLDRVELGEVFKKKCQELSKGMQQKVQFISSIIHEPDLIILDEPFSGLDPVNAKMLRELIAEQSRQGRTLIFSTHVMQHAEQLCDHVFMINRGRKVLDLSMSSIRARHEPDTVIVEPLDDKMEAGPYRALAGVRGVERVGSHLEVRFAEQTDIHDAMRRVFDAARSRRVELKRVSLEDIFIGLVGEGQVSRAEFADAAMAVSGAGGDQ